MKRSRDRYDALSILLDVSRAVSSSLDIQRVGRLVLKESMKALGTDHAALFLVDPGSNRLMLTGAEGFSENEIDNIHLLGSWEAINGELLKKRAPLFVNHLSHGAVFKKKRGSTPLFLKPPVNAFLATRLEKEDGIIGTLIVSNKRRSHHIFTKEDEKLLVTLSNHIAIALAHARLFEELSAAQAEAAQNEKMAVLGTLAAGINHEINNPLGLVRTRCDIFLLDLKEGLYKDVSRKRLLGVSKEIMLDVIRNTDRAVSIAKKLSSFAKPSKGELESVSLNEEIDAVLDIVGHELRMNNIIVERRLDKKLPPLFVDRKQFQEVLFNLIRNAAHAVEKDGKITISGMARRTAVVIDIGDTGSGIPRDKVKELFRPFFTTKEPGGGTGLGLFIVRKIAEKNGGRAYLKKTKVGGGTTFTLEFPVAPATSPSTKKEPAR